MPVLFQFLVFLLIVVFSIVLGFPILRFFKFSCFHPTLSIALASALGLALCSLAATIISHLSLLQVSPWAVTLFMGVPSLIYFSRRLKISELPPLPRGGSDWAQCLLLACVGCHLLLSLGAALAPVTGVDVLVYHLAIPASYLREGGAVYLPSIYESNGPLFVQMLFLFGMWLGGGLVAQLLSWWGLVMSVLVLYGFLRSHGKFPALLCCALYTSISTVYVFSSLAMVDLIATLYLLLAVIALIEFWKNQSFNWLCLAGCFAGIYSSCRLTNAGLVVGLGIALVAFLLVRGWGWQRVTRNFLCFGSISFAMAVFWYFRSWIWTGNPIYPFIWGGREFTIEAAHYEQMLNMYKTLGIRSIEGLSRILWDLTIYPERYRSGHLGPILLAACPILLIYWKRLPRWALLFIFFSTMGTLIWYTNYARLRTWLPVAFCLFALISIALHFFFSERRAPPMVRFVMSGAICLWLALGIANHVRVNSSHIMAAMGFIDRDKFADSTLKDQGFDWYFDMQKLNQLLPEKAQVLIGHTMGYYLDRSYIRASGLLQGLLSEPEREDNMVMSSCLERLGITHVAWHPDKNSMMGLESLRHRVEAATCLELFYESEYIQVYTVSYD